MRKEEMRKLCVFSYGKMLTPTPEMFDAFPEKVDYPPESVSIWFTLYTRWHRLDDKIIRRFFAFLDS